MNSDVKWMKWILGTFLSNYEALPPDCHWPPEHLLRNSNQLIYRHRLHCSCHIFPLGCSSTGNRSSPYCDGFCSLLAPTPESLNLNFTRISLTTWPKHLKNIGEKMIQTMWKPIAKAHFIPFKIVLPDNLHKQSSDATTFLFMTVWFKQT